MSVELLHSLLSPFLMRLFLLLLLLDEIGPVARSARVCSQRFPLWSASPSFSSSWASPPPPPPPPSPSSSSSLLPLLPHSRQRLLRPLNLMTSWKKKTSVHNETVFATAEREAQCHQRDRADHGHVTESAGAPCSPFVCVCVCACVRARAHACKGLLSLLLALCHSTILTLSSKQRPYMYITRGHFPSIALYIILKCL